MKRETPYTHGIPRPTSAPLITAFGTTLVAAGLVTNLWVMVGGAVIAVVGLCMWFWEVFPEERLEEIPETESSGQRADFALPAPTNALHPRGVYPARAHPVTSGVVGGLVGGMAMAVVASLWGLIAHGSVWFPINLLAGCAMPSVGAASAEALRLFDPAWFATACLIHGALSIGSGTLFTLTLPIAPQRPVLAGAVLLPIIATGLVWPTLSIVNPALDAHIAWPWFVASQMAFGVACGWWVSARGTVAAHAGGSVADRLGVHRGKSR